MDSLTARYDTKKYTFSTLPYGSENTIELYNVFFKDYLLLVSVLPDYERNIWQEISFKSIQNNNKYKINCFISPFSFSLLLF